MLLEDLKIHIMENCNIVSHNIVSHNFYWPESVKIILNSNDYFNIYAEYFKNVADNEIKKEYIYTFILNFVYGELNNVASVEIINEISDLPKYKGYRVEKEHCIFIKNRFGSSFSKSNKILTKDERIIKDIIE